jgi:aminoglycoside phosphotransferase (APT) family kinase protein
VTTVAGATEEETIRAWVAAELGGTVVAFRRQARWRPNWLVDVERDGELLELMVRGERVDTPLVFPLRHEMTLQDLLHRNEIPVPTVYGWIDALPAYVMERVPGRPDFTEATEEQRDAVVAEYMTLLARMHRLDVEEFAAAGISRAATPALAGTLGMQEFERTFRQVKKVPDPFMEFALGWLHRHPLDTHGREAPIVWDSGQFHHEDGRVTAVLDVEIGHLGDPLMDLAAFRMRDTVLHYGDLDAMYETYACAGGFDLDLAAIQHHHVAFTLTNQLSFHGALAAPSPGSNYMTNLQWCAETNRHAVEAFAELLGYELPHVEIPGARPSPSAVAHAHQVRALGAIHAEEEFLAYEVRAAFRLARHLQRRDEIGGEVDAADLDDLRGLLGFRPPTPAAGDAALEDYVLVDDGAHDEALVQLFHRRFSRLHATLGPPGSAMATHHVVTPFTKVS